MKKYLSLTAILSLVVPCIASAQNDFFDLATTARDLVNDIAPILVALALLAFFWGIARFVFSAGDERAHEQGKNIMIWGIIALFVMFALWGLVNLIGNTLKLDQRDKDVPRFEMGGGFPCPHGDTRDSDGKCPL